ncbi:small kinetochore-associated protein isoform X2 [Narcine bancroftii]|uniref:small kinetochore-associated protein isoform X2 n=1 Tax=Narcine bancroftii TaxID=1343680 RepID=UPI0038311413
MKRSKLPVYRPKDQKRDAMAPEVSTTNVLRAENTNLQPSAKHFHVNPILAKKDLPQSFNFSQKNSTTVIFEATSNQNVILNKRKKMPISYRMTRGDMEKYMTLKVVEAELRDQNQLLEVAQRQLKQELKLAKDEVNDYMIKNGNLQSENEALSKRAQSCAIILENNLIDPVSANKIIEDHEQTSSCQKDIRPRNGFFWRSVAQLWSSLLKNGTHRNSPKGIRKMGKQHYEEKGAIPGDEVKVAER